MEDTFIAQISVAIISAYKKNTVLRKFTHKAGRLVQTVVQRKALLSVKGSGNL